ncbi:MAG: UTP--glucose-1-phosphate uridylyltransferase [Candidatus Woykebacteria bacterium RIFCSPHIGHO2_01_FULL_39_12]|uniref:UTP--glucose-1-phosphate uridylyltransferase n=2 Tax=Candidatus Woykeibacteriota TaxID=1817899 RepID=A0A1G1WD83_9BACT|nr:MAG: UTP--glucose-1-phosphate uridylyltransferase [Candidatus Woykebacteria bacterium RBG_16_39_9b]OGY27221.1 MAG: UTP--glucose-1-phosphate uridylyltransferase [Candidatus Woykebacteria bacterium RIFCSPHIGHO2_01_FULL_39_12]
MKKITKAVIPAAGFGTRFLPQTKAMPKEMLPVVDKPVIQYVVEEAVASGIEDIIIVTGPSKRAIEDHFDRSYDLENFLEKAGKEEQLEEIRRIANLANFIYIRQKGPYGNAGPVLTAKPLLGDEPFAVLWGDEFIYSQPPRLRQLIDAFNKYESTIISGVKIERKEDLSKYGISKIEPVSGNIYRILEIVEKPDPEKAPSNLATHGAYIFTNSIFKYLENLKPGKGGELWLPEAVSQQIQDEKVYTVEIQNAKYYDTGDKMGYLKAVIDFTLSHPEFAGEIRKYLREILK